MNLSKCAVVVSLLTLSSASVVRADCTRDLEGLTNNFDHYPSTSLSVPGARTTEDFLNGAANAIFFSGAGKEWVEDQVDPQSSFYELGASDIVQKVPVCSDVGQCAQAGVMGRVVTIPGESIDIGLPLGRGVTLGMSVDMPDSFDVPGYEIFIEMGDGSSRTAVIDKRTITGMQQMGSDFDMPSAGTENGAQPSDGCRDNQGEPTAEGPAAPPGGGGGGGFMPPWEPPSPWDDTFYELPSGQCFSCRASEDGVVCRQVAISLCL